MPRFPPLASFFSRYTGLLISRGTDGTSLSPLLSPKRVAGGLLDAVRIVATMALKRTEGEDSWKSPKSFPRKAPSRLPSRAEWSTLLVAWLIVAAIVAVWFKSQRQQQPKTDKGITFPFPDAKPLSTAQQSSSPPQTLPPDSNGWDVVRQKPPKSSAQKADIAEIEKQADALAKQNRFSEAFPLYEQACSGGGVGARNHLGAIYLFGTAGTKDGLRAAAFFNKACDADYALGARL